MENKIRVLYVKSIEQLEELYKIDFNEEKYSELKKICFSHFGIEEIPNLVCDLLTIEELVIFSCKNIKTLPENIGNLKNLKRIEISHVISFSNIPNSVKFLNNLEELMFLDCQNLLEIPEFIGTMEKLNTLIIDVCRNLYSLPDTIWKNNSLELKSSRFIKNPDKLSKLIININNSNVLEKILEFNNLKCLIISLGSIEKLPNDIGKLSKLEEINLSYCYDLKKMPNSILDLKNLKKLSIDYCYSLEYIDLYKLLDNGCEIIGLEKFFDNKRILDIKLRDFIKTKKNLQKLDISKLTLKELYDEIKYGNKKFLREKYFISFKEKLYKEIKIKENTTIFMNGTSSYKKRELNNLLKKYNIKIVNKYENVDYILFGDKAKLEFEELNLENSIFDENIDNFLKNNLENIEETDNTKEIVKKVKKLTKKEKEDFEKYYEECEYKKISDINKEFIDDYKRLGNYGFLNAIFPQSFVDILSLGIYNSSKTKNFDELFDLIYSYTRLRYLSIEIYGTSYSGGGNIRNLSEHIIYFYLVDDMKSFNILLNKYSEYYVELKDIVEKKEYKGKSIIFEKEKGYYDNEYKFIMSIRQRNYEAMNESFEVLLKTYKRLERFSFYNKLYRQIPIKLIGLLKLASDFLGKEEFKKNFESSIFTKWYSPFIDKVFSGDKGKNIIKFSGEIEKLNYIIDNIDDIKYLEENSGINIAITCTQDEIIRIENPYTELKFTDGKILKQYFHTYFFKVKGREEVFYTSTIYTPTFGNIKKDAELVRLLKINNSSKNDFEIISGGYVKTNGNIYYIEKEGRKHVKKVEGIDINKAKSFILGKDTDIYTLSEITSGYDIEGYLEKGTKIRVLLKDDKNIYWKGTKIEGVDVKSYEVTKCDFWIGENIYGKDNNNYYTNYAIDKEKTNELENLNSKVEKSENKEGFMKKIFNKLF